MGRFNYSREMDLTEETPGLEFRYLVITDLHLRVKEQGNRKNILEKYNQFLEDILELIKTTRSIHGVILLGDLWERGVSGKFTDIINPIATLKQISNELNGHLYTLFGNHEEKYCVDNPFYSFVLLPNELLHKLKSKKEVPPFVFPLITAPMELNHTAGKIWFNHFDRKDKNYKVTGVDNGKYNIGLYHDDIVTTETKAKLYHHRVGEGISANSDIFENIDWAICGHNHQPQNEMIVGNDSETLVTIPGTPIQNRVDEVHQFVRLPIIEFYDNRVENKYLTYAMGNILDTVIKDEVKEKKKVMKKALRNYKLALKKSTIEDCLRNAQNREVAEIIIKPERVYQSDTLYRELLGIK